MKTTDLKHISPSLPNEHESKNANSLSRIPNIEESSASARFHNTTDFHLPSKNITSSDKVPGHNHSNKEYILRENHSYVPSLPVNGITKTVYRKNIFQSPNNHSSHLEGNDNQTDSPIEHHKQSGKQIYFLSKISKSDSPLKKMPANSSGDRNLLEKNTSFGNSSKHTDKLLPNIDHLSQSLKSPGFHHSYSQENNLNNSNHHPIKYQNQRVTVPDVEQKSRDTSNKNSDEEALQICKAVKTSKTEYRIREWRYRYGYSWGWTLEAILPLPSAIMPSHDSKNCSISAKDIGHAKRKRDESNCPVNFSNTQSLLENKNGQDAAKGKGYINLPSTNQHRKLLPMNNLGQTEPSVSVNGKYTTSKDFQVANTLQHSQSSVIKKPSPSSLCNSVRKSACDKRNPTIDDSTMEYISSKKDRKPVYSGKKSTQDIQTLKATCINSLKKDVQGINVDVNDTAKKLLMLEQCDPIKLKKMEEQNKDLSKYTNLIWEKFCKRDFGDKITNNGHLWKDIYWRAYEIQENKLKTIKANIVNGIAKAPPERQIKLMENSYNPEKRSKKQKTEDPVKSESSGSDSSSPKYNSQKFSKDVKPVKKTVAPLMSKAKKMVSAVSRRR